MKYKCILGALIAVLTLLPGTQKCFATQVKIVDTRPNILLIMADDLGYETLGYGGGTSYATPNLDKLAKTGIWFENFHSTPYCSPSRVSILTGRYSFRTTTEWAHLPEKEITFGSVLKSAGYKTALAGKWQISRLRDNPHHIRQKGFEETSIWAYGEGPRYWQPMIYQNGIVLTGVTDRYGPDVFTDFLIDFMTHNRHKPFLAYYPMCLPHAPKKNEPKGPDGTWETYKVMVENMDKQIGKLVSALDDLGIREKTLILFTADNGSPKRITSYVGKQGVRGGKGTLKDTGTHVPLIANWQGTTPSGKINKDLIDMTDFMPTLAHLAGADLPVVMIDGSSFAPQLLGKKGKPRDWIYTEWNGRAWVRNKKWKLYSDGKLYNMDKDPFERLPITGLSKETRKVKIQLQSVLYNLHTE